jgi:very-short-patch-repair endonuclease
MANADLRTDLDRAVKGYFKPQSRKDLPTLCDSIGLPPAPDDPKLTKAEYIDSRLSLVDAAEVGVVFERLVDVHAPSMRPPERFAVEETLWRRRSPVSIPKKYRRQLASALQGTPLFLNGQRFMVALENLWVLEDPLDVLKELTGQRSRSLRREIEQHVVLNDGDWPVDYFFEQLGVFDVSDRRFALFLEALASADVRPDEAEQRAFAERVNAVLRSIGVEMREVDVDGGYPVFRIVSIARSAGRPKNLIFASSAKPDLRFRDAVNNDVEVVNGGDQVLVFDRPIPAEGLKWRDLQAWWAETRAVAAADAKKGLYKRLLASLPVKSAPQRRLFEGYFRAYTSRVPNLPALLPEVWLHWDPKTVRERGASALLRFRMDFLMLFSHDVRVVIEVDGKHHYSDDAGRGDPARYGAMMQADRDLRLAGYEVYRFGAAELDDGSAARIKEFFDRLLARHGLG